MRFFLDTANIEHIKEANEMGVIWIVLKIIM